MSDNITRQKMHTLKNVFNRIYRERMADMPMVNPSIMVHAIGFQSWQQDFVGVLVTPWSMNLILLPGTESDWSGLAELTSSTHVFPSGSYDFICAFEAEIGQYKMCSLFSPMFVFADDNSAVETAEAVMLELMQTRQVDEQDIEHAQSMQIEKIWQGEKDKSSVTEPEPEKDRPVLRQKLDQPLSRRQLLRGILKAGDTES